MEKSITELATSYTYTEMLSLQAQKATKKLGQASLVLGVFVVAAFTISKASVFVIQLQQARWWRKKVTLSLLS